MITYLQQMIQVQRREIDPKPLPEGDHNNDVQPKNLADALRMQYEENEK